MASFSLSPLFFFFVSRFILNMVSINMASSLKEAKLLTHTLGILTVVPWKVFLRLFVPLLCEVQWVFIFLAEEIMLLNWPLTTIGFLQMPLLLVRLDHLDTPINMVFSTETSSTAHCWIGCGNHRELAFALNRRSYVGLLSRLLHQCLIESMPLHHNEVRAGWVFRSNDVSAFCKSQWSIRKCVGLFDAKPGFDIKTKYEKKIRRFPDFIW